MSDQARHDGGYILNCRINNVHRGDGFAVWNRESGVTADPMKEMGDMPRKAGHLAQYLKSGELFVCNLAANGNLPEKIS